MAFLPAEDGHIIAGFMMGCSQSGGDLHPGQSTSVKTASACTHKRSTPQREGKKKTTTKKLKIKGKTEMMTKCIQVATGKISEIFSYCYYKTMLATDIKDQLLYVRQILKYIPKQERIINKWKKQIQQQQFQINSSLGSI